MRVLAIVSLVLACLLFLCAACGWPPGPISRPTEAGLFCFALAVLLAGLPSPSWPWVKAS